jgi:hypothetical protein
MDNFIFFNRFGYLSTFPNGTTGTAIFFLKYSTIYTPPVADVRLKSKYVFTIASSMRTGRST